MLALEVNQLKKTYKNGVVALKGIDLQVEEGDFFAELDKAIRTSYPKPKMLVLNFPSNPTGDCVELDFFEKVVVSF